MNDGDLARFFRHGIDHRGQVGLPIMMFADLSEGGLAAILSFLRTLAPIRNPVAPSGYNVLGKITKAFFLKPFSPDPTVSASPEPGPTPEYGGYLAKVVANCASCHTARNMKTGEFTGPPFAGGMVFRSSESPGEVVVSPTSPPTSSRGPSRDGTGTGSSKGYERET